MSQSPAAGQAEHVYPVGTYTPRNKLYTYNHPHGPTESSTLPNTHISTDGVCSCRHEQHRKLDPVTPLLLIRIEVHQRSHTCTVQVSSALDTQTVHLLAFGPSLSQLLASGPTDAGGSQSSPAAGSQTPLSTHLVQLEAY